MNDQIPRPRDWIDNTLERALRIWPIWVLQSLVIGTLLGVAFGVAIGMNA